MTPLRQRMLEDLQLRGLSANTQRSYIWAVRQFSEYYRKSPDKISDEELRSYFLYLKNVKKYSSSSLISALCGIKFFYEYTLKRPWPELGDFRFPKVRKLPSILSIEEINHILSCVKQFGQRTCLFTIYSCGLRVGEAVSLEVKHVDSARKTLHISLGKGRKDRYVPLPDITLELLRSYWRTHRHPKWLFPSPSFEKRDIFNQSLYPITTTSVGKAFRLALKKSGIHKRVSVHSLRHSYATHLLESGMSLRFIQECMGHASLRTTVHYAQLTQKAQRKDLAELEKIMHQFSDNCTEHP